MATIVPQPALAWHHPAFWLATWFGAGLLPRAPGTWGSLAALPIAWIFAVMGGPWLLVAAAALIFAAGCWATACYLRAQGSDQIAKDPQAIVIDEVAAQWLVLAVVPPDPLLYAAGFVLFRIADIAKPWPASWADRRVDGALGVMLDDALAAPYAMAGLWAVQRWLAP
ncbi:MAG: phosphatidylglycerophosphatase A [Alphaproteobacteria bacterium]|nr:phosphatidylglycerophosphatase A [Alphaproteobacteria bacterium]